MDLSKLILGTAQLGLPQYGINNSVGKPSDLVAFGILDLAREFGIDTLDTAEAYGDSEEVIGRYTKNSNSSNFKVITKLHSFENESIHDKVEGALLRLSVDHIDTMLFHSHKDFLQNSSALDELLEEKYKGTIRKIGVSVYSQNEILALTSIPEIDVIQVPFNMLDNDKRKGKILRQAKFAGKIIHTRSAFLQGLFFMDSDRISSQLIGLSNYFSELHEIAQGAKVSMNQLALGYALSKDYIDGVLIGVETEEQLLDNLSLSKICLSHKVIERIDKIDVLDSDLLNPSIWKV